MTTNGPSTGTGILGPIDPYSVPTLCASSSLDAYPDSDFFRSCTLCCDGSVAMTECESQAVELYNLQSESHFTESDLISLSPARRFHQPASVLGTLWYPTATPADPSSFCFLASVRECPVKLLDASDGRLRASYKIVDHRERQVAPNSMVFNSTSSKIYCGFLNAIEVFDVNYPGEGDRIQTTPSKKTKSGLKGIISSLAFCPDYSGLYAAGTFSASISLFSESGHDEISQSLGGVMGPVTQVKFNPMRPHLLYATSRQTNSILSWDLRGDVSTPLQKFCRPGLTNQRLSFDIDTCGKTMVTGDTNGIISCFALDGEMPEKPTIRTQAHGDAIAATAIHPVEPVVVSVSGSRHFDQVLSDHSTSGSESSDDFAPKRRYRRPKPISNDTTIKLWRLSIRDDLHLEAGV